MESFERVYAALRGKPVDRPPVFPQIGDHAGIIHKLTYNRMYEDAKLAADAHLKALDLYKYDITQIDLENLEVPDFMKTKSSRVMIEGTSILANEAEVPIAAFMTGPITFSFQLMPYELLIKKMLKDPEFTHALVKKSVMIIKKYIISLKEVGATLLVICEHDFQMLKPKLIKEFSLDYLPDLFGIYQYNILHMCGKVAPHLNELADDFKRIKKLNTLNIGPFVDIKSTQDLLKHKIGIAGNIDHIKLLPRGSPNEIETAVHKAIESSGGDSRFMVAPGCEITADTPIKNVKAFVNATQSYNR